MAPDVTSLRVLVVDDDEPLRELVCKILRRMGIADVETAPNGAAALERMSASQPFDVVVCDWNMPTLPGIEVLKHVRATTPHTAFLMTTGETDRQFVQQAKGCGANGFLVKPFTPTQLKEQIGMLLEGGAKGDAVPGA
jgi:two-component system, chemotaxis family, chemotaxis protein CheY